MQKGEQKTLEEKIVLNNRFINLINFKKSKLKKEKEKLLVDLQLSADALFNEKSKHTLFYDNEEEVLQDQFLNKKTKRDSMIKTIANAEQKEEENQSFNSKALLSKYRQKEKSYNDLNAISKGLTEQKESIVIYYHNDYYYRYLGKERK